MKFIALIIMFSATIAFAEAGSFESFLNQQSTTTISPIEYQGLPVVSRSKGGEWDAGMICASLGFNRTVSSQTELRQFQLGDKVAFAKGAASSAPFLDVETVGTRQIRILTSIQCAK